MANQALIDVATRALRPGLGKRSIVGILVHEDEDWAGEPSLFVDVLLAPDAQSVDGDLAIRLRRSLSKELGAVGERRFPYIKFRTEGEKADDVEAEQA